MTKSKNRHKSRPALVDELAAMEVNDLHITTEVASIVEFHSAKRGHASIAGMRFRAFMYDYKCYIVRVG